MKTISNATHQQLAKVLPTLISATSGTTDVKVSNARRIAKKIINKLQSSHH